MRSTAKRWIAINSAVFGLVLVALTSLVVGRSEWLLRRQHSPPTETITAAVSAQDLKEGERLAVIVGCWEGCHGKRGEGGAEGVGGYFQATAPTLSQVLPEYSDEELAQVIRYGVKRDQRTAIGMIARTFYPLSNRDLALIIGHLRQSPTLQPVPRARQVTVRGRIALALGTWKTSADEVDRSRPRWGELPRRTPFEQGRYLASITCSECHGLDFRGNPLEGGPSLLVVGRYNFEQFRQLIRTGEPIGGRDLGIMSRVTRNAFSRFTDSELRALYTFLRTSFGFSSNSS